METAEKGPDAADVRVKEVLKMPQTKKDYKNFGCKLDRVTFERLEEFCKISGQNKTLVVERAIQKYLDENMEMMREVAKRL